MTKLVKAVHVAGHTVRLEFSDGTWGDCDLAYVVQKGTALTEPLREPAEFRRFFVDAGALAWPNGLDLDPETLHARLEQAGKLHARDAAA